jgi:hypothetical protein
VPTVLPADRPQVGIPDDVWNMDARAGANTEVDAAGAAIEKPIALSTHTTVENSEHYRRKAGSGVASRRSGSPTACGRPGPRVESEQTGERRGIS